MIDILCVFLVCLTVCSIVSREFFTANETRKLLRIRAEKLQKWIEEGLLEAYDVSERPRQGKPRWRISRESLQKFLDTRAPKPLTPTPPPKRKRKPERPAGWVEYIL